MAAKPIIEKQTPKARIIRLADVQSLFLHLEKLETNPKFPTSTPKMSGVFVMEANDPRIEMVRQAALDVMVESLEDRWSQVGEGRPFSVEEAKKMAAGQLSTQKINNTLPFKVIAPRPDGKFAHDVGKFQIKGNSSRNVPVYVKSETGYKPVDNDSPEAIAHFYNGGRYSVALQFYVSKTGNLCSGLSGVYYVSAGTPLGGHQATADEFECEVNVSNDEF